MAKELLAHVRQDEQGNWLEHSLKEHLEGTAKLAEEFAAVFGLNTLADIIGKVHDYGKASQKFQDKIDPELHVNLHVDHSTAGAQFLVEQYGDLAILLAYIVAGHHGGLPNGKDEHESCLLRRLKKPVEEYYSRVPVMLLPEKILPENFMPLKRTGKFDLFSFHFLIRMFYSVLTDADFLDTEAFMTPETHTERQRDTGIVTFHARLEQFLTTFQSNSELNQKRGEILKWLVFGVLNNFSPIDNSVII